MDNIYYLKVGEYDLTVTVTHENVRLSFNKSSVKGVSEFMYFIIPLKLDETDNIDEPSRFTEFIKHCDEQDKSEFPFLGGDD